METTFLGCGYGPLCICPYDTITYILYFKPYFKIISMHIRWEQCVFVSSDIWPGDIFHPNGLPIYMFWYLCQLVTTIFEQRRLTLLNRQRDRQAFLRASQLLLQYRRSHMKSCKRQGNNAWQNCRAEVPVVAIALHVKTVDKKILKNSVTIKKDSRRPKRTIMLWIIIMWPAQWRDIERSFTGWSK